MISFIAKLIVALNSNSRPFEMASAIAFGLWLALIPGGNLLWVLLFVMAFFLKHNIGALLFSMGIFRLMIPIFDSILDAFGGVILEVSFLQGFYIFLYNLPLLPYTGFNNSLIMGSFIMGLILWFPIFLIFTRLIKLYRKKVAPKIADSKIIKALKKIPILSKVTKAVTELTSEV